MSLYPESVYPSVDAAAAAVVQSGEPELLEPPCLDGLETRLRNAAPEVLAYVWGAESLDLDRLVWCQQCCRVYSVGDIWLSDGEVFCAFCSNPVNDVWWWNDWPRLALLGWVAEPKAGTFYFLGGSVYLSMNDPGNVGYEPYQYLDDENRFLTAPPPEHNHAGEWVG